MGIDNLFTDRVVTSDRVLYTPSSFAKTSLMYLQEIGSLTANKPHTSKRNGLDSYLFFVVNSGRGELIYDGIAYKLKAGDCVFISCEKNYSHSTSPEDLWSLSWIHFNGLAMAAIYEKYIARGGKPVFNLVDIKPLTNLHRQLMTVAKSVDYIKDMRINAALNELLVLIMNESWNPEEGANTKKGNILAIKMYLDEHFSENINLDELAALFYINKFYMLRIFKEQYGVSINTYLQQVKITHAKQYLRFTDDSLELIGIKCGINQPHYFSRMFKNIEGISPSEYRKKWKADK